MNERKITTHTTTDDMFCDMMNYDEYGVVWCDVMSCHVMDKTELHTFRFDSIQ